MVPDVDPSNVGGSVGPCPSRGRPNAVAGQGEAGQQAARKCQQRKENFSTIFWPKVGGLFCLITIFNIFFKKKWADPGLFFVYFRPFLVTISIIQIEKSLSSFSAYNFNNTNCKKRRWCAWDLNPGRENGRHRRSHRAMASSQFLLLPSLSTST